MTDEREERDLTDCEVRYRQLVAKGRCIYCHILEVERERDELKAKLDEVTLEWHRLNKWSLEQSAELEQTKARLGETTLEWHRLNQWCLKQSVELERLKKELAQADETIRRWMRDRQVNSYANFQVRTPPAKHPDKED